jgi:cytochrome c oxidase subunit 3
MRLIRAGSVVQFHPGQQVKFKIYTIKMSKRYPAPQHTYHLVSSSPWPFLTATSAGLLLVSIVGYMHSIVGGKLSTLLSLSLLVFFMGLWWRDVVREGLFMGNHTFRVQAGLRYGMFLFILSEVCFFVAFFWAFFHSSLSPTVEIGSVWPPEGFVTFYPWGVPFLNTLLLLSSGAAITAAHHFILVGSRLRALRALEYTVALAVVFTGFQALEYTEAPFTIADGVYGSVFFMATGFHGFHVIIGTIMLIVSAIRLYKFHFARQHHFGFEAAAWYWHFVDVVWLFLFVTIYWWGSL